MRASFSKIIKPFLYLGIFYLLLSCLLRIVLILHPITTTSFSLPSLLKIFMIGGINDLFIFLFCSFFLFFNWLLICDKKYDKPWIYFRLIVYLAALVYVLFFNNIFKEYGAKLDLAVAGFLLLKLIALVVMWQMPNRREEIRKGFYFVFLLFYVCTLTMIAISEYFFWNEFGVRFNFIAVDYLIYTNEVIGNIMESYPMIPLMSITFIVALSITFLLWKRTKESYVGSASFKEKTASLCVYCGLCCFSLLLIPRTERIKAESVFEHELCANGIKKFYTAFMSKELDYDTFFCNINDDKAENNVLKEMNREELEQRMEKPFPDLPERKKNIILISIESLSSSFLAHFGNKNNLTPFLDSIADKSIFFTNLYSTGTRTVRGLEALSMGIVPVAGESVIKRKNYKNKHTIGSVLKEKGYATSFFYGGHGSFDNMGNFFSCSDYDVYDRKSLKDSEITFSNIWGVCDEDMAKKLIQESNKMYEKEQPFYNHWMTVSNHRPFTIPKNTVNMGAQYNKTRESAVRYTDYALEKFFKMAEKEPWFDNTVFVFISDHCAASSGKTSVPPDIYRIPAIIYSSDTTLIKPQRVDCTTSQIDIIPTLLGILNFSYDSKFMGKNVFDKEYTPRAFLITYNDLAYLQDSCLTVLSPTKQIKQFKVEHNEKESPFSLSTELIQSDKTNDEMVEKCISFYQTSAKWLKSGRFDKNHE